MRIAMIILVEEALPLLLITFQLLQWAPLSHASYCGPAAIPYGFEVRSDGQPLLGCARPICFSRRVYFETTRKAPSRAVAADPSFYLVKRRPDGWFRKEAGEASDKGQWWGKGISSPHSSSSRLEKFQAPLRQHHHILLESQLALCPEHFFYQNASCSGGDTSGGANSSSSSHWVGGMQPREESLLPHHLPMALHCCEYPPLRNLLLANQHYERVVVRPGEIWLGGEVPGDSNSKSHSSSATKAKYNRRKSHDDRSSGRRVYAFDYVSNLARHLLPDGTLSYSVHVRRMPCMPPPLEWEVEVEHQVGEDITLLIGHFTRITQAMERDTIEYVARLNSPIISTHLSNSSNRFNRRDGKLNSGTNKRIPSNSRQRAYQAPIATIPPIVTTVPTTTTTTTATSTTTTTTTTTTTAPNITDTALPGSQPAAAEAAQAAAGGGDSASGGAGAESAAGGGETGGTSGTGGLGGLAGDAFAPRPNDNDASQQQSQQSRQQQQQNAPAQQAAQQQSGVQADALPNNAQLTPLSQQVLFAQPPPFGLDSTAGAESNGGGEGVGNGYGGGGGGGGACFTGDTLVLMTPDGVVKRMDQLRVGEWILTTSTPTKVAAERNDALFSNHNETVQPLMEAVYTRVELWLHRVPGEWATFHRLELDDGRVLKATAKHLIYRALPHECSLIVATAGDVGMPVPVEQVRPGDCLYTLPPPGSQSSFSQGRDTDAQALVPRRVVNVSVVLERGIYAPLTTSGTLLAEGVLASCHVLHAGDDSLGWLQRSYFATFSGGGWGRMRWWWEWLLSLVFPNALTSPTRKPPQNGGDEWIGVGGSGDGDSGSDHMHDLPLSINLAEFLLDFILPSTSFVQR